MTYSILTCTGNLVDAFEDREAAVSALTDIARAEPESDDEVFLFAQDDDGYVGETVYESSLPPIGGRLNPERSDRSSGCDGPARELRNREPHQVTDSQRARVFSRCGADPG